MKTFKHLKFLAVATFGILFSSVASGQVISQVIAGSVAGALEIYNPSSTTSMTLTTTGFDINVSVDHKSQNNLNWGPSSDIVLEPRQSIVIVGLGSEQSALITYLESIGNVLNEDYFVTTLPIRDNDAIQIVQNGSVVDGIGAFQTTGQANWCKNCIQTVNQVNFERDLEYLETTFNTGVDVSNPNVQNATGFESVYQPLATLTAPTYNIDDFEGLGISPGNIKFNGTNYSSPSNPNGATTMNSSPQCHIEVTSTAAVSIERIHKIKELVVPAGGDVTLSADANGFAQAKKIKVRGNTATNGNPTIRQERYFATVGWHVIGSPFTEGFSNTSGVGASRSWYWAPNPSDPTKMHWEEGTVPEGLGIMVYVDEASDPKSYAYARVGDKLTLSGTPHETFEWNTSGLADAPLYNLPDGHTGVGSDGINMLANPFNCALDWSVVYNNINTSGIESTVSVWSPTVGGWIQFDASISPTGQALQQGIIPPMAAFDVFVTQGAPSASIFASVEEAGSQSSSFVYNKNASASFPNTISLGIKSTKDLNGHTNTAQVAYSIGATTNYDQGLDSRKMINSGNGYPDIYIPGDTMNMYTNHVDIYQNPSINVAVTELSAGSTYVISAQQSIFDGSNEYDLSLEDKYLNVFANLSSGDYTFTQPQEELDPNRFVLHINQNVVNIHEEESEGVYTYTSNGDLFLNSGNCDVDKAIIFTIDGRMLCEVSINAPVQKITNLMSSKSVYLVKIVLKSGEVITNKVLL